MMATELDTLGGLTYFTSSTTTEQRAEDRLFLSRQPEGKLSVCTPYAQVAAYQVRDISRSGISLELERPISADTAVSVDYLADDIHLTVNGRIVWGRAPTGGGDGGSRYVVGIELFSPGLLLNFLPTAAVAA
ncbi:MAG: PilZ domain-containing protein [Pseudomonadota bacterium]|nr:PilZ domain-containing protein [Pseudomonadota bacterium]